jgi:hypothetical protein
VAAARARGPYPAFLRASCRIPAGFEHCPDAGSHRNAGRITELSQQLSDTQHELQRIGQSNIVTGKAPIKVEIANGGAAASPGSEPLDVHVSDISVQPNPQYGKNAKQFILTTNKVMDGARLSIHCENKINQGTARIAGAQTQMGGSYLKDSNTLVTGIEFPNWSPSHPLIITLHFDEANLGECVIKP